MNVDEFRIANEADASAIAGIVNAAYRPSPGTPGWTHESELVAGDRISPLQVIEIIRKTNSVILVGFINLAIVTCVHIEKKGNSGHIGLLAVSPVLQTAGLGKQMLSLAEHYAREIFCVEQFILVVVSARRELIAFYLRRGYERTGEVTDYPISADVGIPKNSDLKIEVLQKQSNHALITDGLGPRVSGASPKATG